ncbi:MAG: hypothetical protein WC389_18285 [Lutibacter sp.]|jgi:hypothetical protein
MSIESSSIWGNINDSLEIISGVTNSILDYNTAKDKLEYDYAALETQKDIATAQEKATAATLAATTALQKANSGSTAASVVGSSNTMTYIIIAAIVGVIIYFWKFKKP